MAFDQKTAHWLLHKMNTIPTFFNECEEKWKGKATRDCDKAPLFSWGWISLRWLHTQEYQGSVGILLHKVCVPTCQQYNVTPSIEPSWQESYPIFCLTVRSGLVFLFLCSLFCVAVCEVQALLQLSYILGLLPSRQCIWVSQGNSPIAMRGWRPWGTENGSVMVRTCDFIYLFLYAYCMSYICKSVW